MITVEELFNLFNLRNIGFIVCHRNVCQEELDYNWIESGPIFIDGKASVIRTISGFLEYWNDKIVRKITVYGPGTYIKPDGEYVSEKMGTGLIINTN